MFPALSSLSPNSAAPGPTFSLTITGSKVQDVTDMDFEFMGMQFGGMMGGGTGSGMGNEDTNLRVSNVQVDAAGTQIPASARPRLDSPGHADSTLQTTRGEAMLPGGLFTVTK